MKDHTLKVFDSYRELSDSDEYYYLKHNMITNRILSEVRKVLLIVSTLMFQ